MADPESAPAGDGGGLEATTRQCPDCGQIFVGERHEGCPGPGSGGGSVRRGHGSTSRLDDLPAEARPFDADPARQLNQYVLVRQIGRGGMGAVWKAWDRKLTRWVAIKFLLAAEDEDIARFQREAKLAARLRHPNIAPIYEVGEAPARDAGQQPRNYLAMEFIDGQSLASVQLPLRETVDLFVKVARGVEAAHKAGVIHRDLKPANVMLTSDRWPYVMDFGLAKSLQTESSLSVSGAVMGTPAYMPPEQAQGRVSQVDARSDVYSLGATMYAVLCHKPPFEGESAMDVVMKACHEDPVPPRTLNAEIPEPMERIILKAMAKTKEDRYPSAGELADDLQQFLGDGTVAAKAPVRRSRRGRWGAIAGVAVALLAAAGYLLYPGPETPPPVAPAPVPPAPAPPATPAPGTPEPAKPVDPGPSAEDRLRQRQQAWRDAWAPLRVRLDFDAWKPGDAQLPAQARGALARMAADASPADAIDASDWARAQTRAAETALGALSGTIAERQAGATRIAGWCETFLATTQGVDSLATPAETATRVRAEALKVAAFRGTFTLRLFVEPYAEVRRCLCDGQPVTLPATHTPLVAPQLPIGEYELVLAHPQLGEKTVTIKSGDLQDGKRLRISGRMQDKALATTVEP